MKQFHQLFYFLDSLFGLEELQIHELSITVRIAFEPQEFASVFNLKDKPFLTFLKSKLIKLKKLNLSSHLFEFDIPALQFLFDLST